MTTDNVPDSKWDMARTEMSEIAKALHEWSLKNDGQFPDSLDEVAGQFAGGRTPVDPFKEPYLYERTEGGFTLTCLGSDKAVGGAAKPEADIVFDQRGQLEPAE